MSQLVPYVYRDLLKTGIPAINDGHLSDDQTMRPIAYGDCQPGNLTETRLTASFDVVSQGEGKAAAVVLARPWNPGYQATLNGTPLPVRCCNLGTILVEIPPNASGHVVLRYLPPPLLPSLAVVAVTLLATLFLFRNPRS
jgi:hypothetical protein